MVAKIALVLAVIYVPTMWILAVFCGLLGIMGLALPSMLCSLIRVFTHKNRAWLIGSALLLLGAEIFVRAPGVSVPLLVRCLGTFVFISGGVVLFLPTLTVIIAEWFAGLSSTRLRVVGIICLGLAYVFYLGARAQYIHIEKVAQAVFLGGGFS